MAPTSMHLCTALLSTPSWADSKVRARARLRRPRSCSCPGLSCSVRHWYAGCAEAVADADQALQLDGRCAQAHYRQGCVTCPSLCSPSGVRRLPLPRLRGRLRSPLGIHRSVCRVAYFQLGEFGAACRSFGAAAELESSRTTNMWLRKARAELEGAAQRGAPSSLVSCQLHSPLCASRLRYACVSRRLPCGSCWHACHGSSTPSGGRFAGGA